MTEKMRAKRRSLNNVCPHLLQLINYRFVTATPGRDVQRNKPHLFRTYEARDVGPTSALPGGPFCKIWEAVRATSAAPLFFDSIHLGPEEDKQEYVDGGVGCNNPCNQLYREARRIWPERKIECIISLGTGIPRILSKEDPTLYNSWWPKDWFETLARIATLCEKTHEDMRRIKELNGKYFRFNVQQGMQRISLEEWKKLGEVATHTQV
jgi:predicted acylesterase/phospholipase RssA